MIITKNDIFSKQNTPGGHLRAILLLNIYIYNGLYIYNEPARNEPASRRFDELLCGYKTLQHIGDATNTATTSDLFHESFS